ncbi:hypothetical protein OQA88_4041 [Cercophora sp. LCS_1]
MEDDSPRHKRPKYIPQYNAPYQQYGDSLVAFKAMDEHQDFPLHQALPAAPKPNHYHHQHPHQHPARHHSPHPHPRPHHHPSPHRHQTPEPSASTMERTASGLSTQSEPTERCGLTELLEDQDAEQRVRDHMATFRRRNPDSKHERILRSIINPRSGGEDELDNDSLESIFSAANEMFFNGRLSKRVRWDWSHESSARYDSQVIGTTALRRASNRGFETLIVLSSPILKDSKYSRRLLISTFLHELIHSFLFICCGFRARSYGGHTPAFHAIAKMIDDWAGPESALYLSKMEADLEQFRIDHDERRWEGDNNNHHHHNYYQCSGVTEQEGHRHHHPSGPSPDPYPGASTSNATWWTNRAVRSLDSIDSPGPPYV